MNIGLSRNHYFDRGKKERVITIDVAEYEGLVQMPEYNGIWTIKNINPPTSDDLFYIDHRNTLEGFLDAKGAKTINLVTGKKKLVRSICNSFYHSVLDDISEILYALHMFPDHQLIIDISDVSYMLGHTTSERGYFEYFLDALDSNKVDYKLVNLKDFDIVYLDNFKVVYFAYESGQKTNLVYDFFKSTLDKKVRDIEPTRKIFVSRAYQVREDVVAPGLGYHNDHRMDDPIGLEETFRDLGFEIVHAELLPTFKDQLELFSQAKVIAGVTGSGLTNAAFMPPGGTVIEIVTPLIVSIAPPHQEKDITKPWFTQEIHNFYKNIAFYQNHNYVGLQNADRSLEEFKENLEANPYLKEYLRNV